MTAGWTLAPLPGSSRAWRIISDSTAVTCPDRPACGATPPSDATEYQDFIFCIRIFRRNHFKYFRSRKLNHSIFRGEDRSPPVAFNAGRMFHKIVRSNSGDNSRSLVKKVANRQKISVGHSGASEHALVFADNSRYPSSNEGIASNVNGNVKTVPLTHETACLRVDDLVMQSRSTLRWQRE